MKKKFLKAPFIMTVLFTNNAAFCAPNTTGTVTGAALAATLNKDAGIVTTESLTTAALTKLTYVITNNKVAATSQVQVTLNGYGGTTGTPQLVTAKCTANTITVVIVNSHATEALNGAIAIGFSLIEPIV